MSEPRARPTTALLARKGRASPVGAVSDAAGDSAPDPETLPELGVSAKTGAAPAASLLPLDFLAGRSPGGPPERPGARDLAQIPQDSPEAAAAPATSPKAAAKLAPSGGAVPLLSATPEGPRPDPALGPTLRPALRSDAGARPAARAAPRRFPTRAAGLVLALAAAGYGYQSGWFGSQPPERPKAPAAAAVAPVQAQPQATDTVLAPTGAPAVAPPVTEPDPGARVDQPSVDVVRIEPDGAAVIAGRAAPGVELILLDNGAPIGTVTADAYGEWVFIPAGPLPSGAHDFGLVIKEVRGGVSLPAAGQAPAIQDATGPGAAGTNEPGTVAGADAAVPIPPRKPDIETNRSVGAQAVGAPSPAFVVQLASVKSRIGAQREWRALRKRFPDILSQMSLSLDEAKLAGGATVVRLRIGAFPKQAEADALCARLAARRQDCLVVRTAAANH